MLAASAASFAQLAQNDATAAKDCGSVVIIKCDQPAPETSSAQTEFARQQARRGQALRQDPLRQQLEGVVIEGELTRRRSIEETMASAFPAVRARDGTYTVERAAGSKCTCMNVCPPWPLPCCTCSSPMSNYRSMPGSSPLN